MRLEKAYIALGEEFPGHVRADSIPDGIDQYIVDARHNLEEMKEWLQSRYLSSEDGKTEVIIYQMTPIAVLRLPVKTEEVSVDEFLSEISEEKPQ